MIEQSRLNQLLKLGNAVALDALVVELSKRDLQLDIQRLGRLFL